MTQALRVRLAPAAPDEDGMKIYVPADVADSLKTELEDNGYQTSWGLEKAFGVDDAIIVVASLTAAPKILNGVANILRAVFDRNQHRSITLESGDVEVTLNGLSEQETKTAVQKALDRVVEGQKASDENWHKILEETDDSGTVD